MEYHSMIGDNQSSPALSYSDTSAQRDHSQQMAAQQRDGFSNGMGDRWRPVVGQAGSPDTSFQSHYSGYAEHAVRDDSMWHRQEEVDTHR